MGSAEFKEIFLKAIEKRIEEHQLPIYFYEISTMRIMAGLVLLNDEQGVKLLNSVKQLVSRGSGNSQYWDLYEEKQTPEITSAVSSKKLVPSKDARPVHRIHRTNGKVRPFAAGDRDPNSDNSDSWTINIEEWY